MVMATWHRMVVKRFVTGIALITAAQMLDGVEQVQNTAIVSTALIIDQNQVRQRTSQ